MTLYDEYDHEVTVGGMTYFRTKRGWMYDAENDPIPQQGFRRLVQTTLVDALNEIASLREALVEADRQGFHEGYTAGLSTDGRYS